MEEGENLFERRTDMGNTVNVHGAEISILSINDKDYISLTDMLKAKDGDFFISDWLRNRNTVEFLGIWEQIHNPNFNYGEFAIIRSNAGLNSYKISVKEWVEKQMPLEYLQRQDDMEAHMRIKILPLNLECGLVRNLKYI